MLDSIHNLIRIDHKKPENLKYIRNESRSSASRSELISRCRLAATDIVPNIAISTP